MNLIERVKNILITPKTEWLVIDTEVTTPQNTLMSYVLPLAVISALGTVLSIVFYSSSFINYSIWSAIIKFISIIIGFYISTYVIDMLAPSFGSDKNLGKSAQLVAYSYTPALVAGFFSFIPVLGVLIAIAGAVYSIYLFYSGIGILKKTPEDKKVVYMLVSFILMVAVTFIISAILTAIFASIIGFGTIGRGFGF